MQSPISQTVSQRLETLMERLGKDFSIEGLNKSPARFNLKKLQDINSRFIRMMSLEEFVLRAHLLQLKIDINESFEISDDSPYPLILEHAIKNNTSLPKPSSEVITQYCAWLLDKNRVITLSEFGKESDCVLNWKQPSVEDVKWRKSSVHDSISNLQEIGEFVLGLYEHNPHHYPTHVDQVEHYMKESSLWWEESIKNWINSMEYSAGDYLWPLRVALSGQTKSPSPFEILAAISKTEAENRLNLVTKSL